MRGEFTKVARAGLLAVFYFNYNFLTNNIYFTL